MKLYNIKSLACIALLGLSMSSCEKYLDKPTEDGYDTSNYYSNDAQCRAGVNYLYNSPWYDFMRGFFKVGEVMSGNYYMGSSPYLTFTLDGSDADLANMSASLWAVNTHSTTVYNNIKNASGASEAVKNATMGECLTWKAMAYFYMVRSFGAVPIIHMPVETINSQQSTSLRKAKISNIYDYIILLLEKAITLLPDSDPTKNGRIDKYAAKALLAKVYLTKAGFSEENTTYNPGTYSYITCTAHQRNAADLAKAAELALDVIENSGRKLMDNYSDIFRGENNVCDEALISWAWTMGSHWTCQNSFHCDLSIEGFDENGDCWGGWGGPSVDLQDAFNENALSLTRQNVDDRRKATLMMVGDHYDYFWADCGGFEMVKYCYGGYADNGAPGPGQWESPTGACEVKHLYGNNADHTTILPFTRLVGGPMDYTPGIFETDLSKICSWKKQRISSTLAGQLALYVTMFSPLQMAADVPESYEKRLDALQFIKDVPCDWNESRYLEAEIGDYLTIVRRAKGKDEWYLGMKTDENAHAAEIRLDFLTPGKAYEATIYADAPDAVYRTETAGNYVIEKRTVSSADTLRLRAAPGGGAAVSFKPNRVAASSR